MVIRFTCKCGKSLKAPDEYIGKKVECSKCKTILRVPEEDQPETTKKKKSKTPVHIHEQELSLPPLSEVRSREEVLSEKSSSAPVAEAPASSNIAQQLLRKSGSKHNNETGNPDDHSAAKVKPDQNKTGVSKWLDENKSFAEYLKYNAKRIIPGFIGVIILCYGLYAIMSASLKTVGHPPLETVSGTITLDDKPLPHAEVIFIPQDEWKEDHKPSDSRGFTDDQGKFELQYLKDLPGAALGKHIVRIISSETNIPIIYNVKTVLTYEVKDGTNNAEFKLVSH